MRIKINLLLTLLLSFSILLASCSSENANTKQEEGTDIEENT